MEGAGSARRARRVAPLGECERAVAYFAALWEMAGSFWEAGFPSIAYVVEQALNKVTRDEVKAEHDRVVPAPA